jgi:hypothetical protein
LPHQRRARGGINRRVCADKKKFQPVVGKVFVRVGEGLRFLGNLL